MSGEVKNPREELQVNNRTNSQKAESEKELENPSRRPGSGMMAPRRRQTDAAENHKEVTQDKQKN